MPRRCGRRISWPSRPAASDNEKNEETNMSDAYIGGLASWGSVAALQQAAEAVNAVSEVDDETARETTVDPHLTGQSPTAAGSPCTAEVPNLSVTKVTTG